MNIVYPVLLLAAFAVIELLIGGTRLVFSLPAYGLLALAALVSLASLRRPKVRPDRWCLLSSGVFFGYLLARAYTSPVVYLAWSDEFAILGALIVYLLTACYLTDPGRRLWMLMGLLVLAGVNLAVGIKQFSEGSGYMLFGFLRSPQYLGRASGLYICPDHLAGFFEMVICLSLAMVFWSRCKPWLKLLLGYGALCSVVGLLLTASRGGMLSLGVGFVVLAGLSLWRAGVAGLSLTKALLVLLVVGGILGGGAAVILARSETIHARTRVMLDSHDIRPMLWAAGRREFADAPVWGTGAATYLYYGRRYREPVMQSDPVRPHSDYLELLAEYGLVGAAGFLLFFGAHLRWGLRTFRVFARGVEEQSGRRGGSNAAAWNIGALSAVACLAAHSVVDFNLHIPANALVLAFVFGVIANPGRAVDEANYPLEGRATGADLLPRLVLPALGVWLLAAGAPRFPGAYFAEQARVALREHRDALALNFARRGLEYEHQDPILYGYLGEARLNLAGNGPDTPFARSFREAAVEAYRAAARLSPQDSYLLVRLGEAYTRLGDYSRAAEVFRQALLWDPNSGYVLTYYGFYLQTRGDLAGAESTYQRALSLLPYEAARQGVEDIERLKNCGGRKYFRNL